MSNSSDPAGSIWRRWDLHLHTPITWLSNNFADAGTDAAWDRYIDALEASPVAAFGITEYFGCGAFFELRERYDARYPSSRKVFFANIEFRLSESISKNGAQPHLHVIFDNDARLVSREKLERFCSNLNTQGADGSGIRVRCADLDTPAKIQAATVSLDHITSALSETFGSTRPYLIVFPANNDGLRSTDSRSPRKVQLADRIDEACDAFFGGPGNREFFLKSSRYSSDLPSKPKPVISGSDAHSFEDLERLSGDVGGFPSTWIKADLTFRGLQQICFEPADRVFIGSEPPVIVRQARDPTKFVKELAIDQIENYDERNGRWFKAVTLPLNPELTAIIGNKGSCKSAIVDVLGLLGESRQEAFFSFLVDGPKNKKFRQPGYAENFCASITWSSAVKAQKNLMERVDPIQPETMRYLPQNYFEQLTNEIEIEKFRKEIEEVVFSHVEESDRLGKASFSELEEFKTLQGKQEISALKRRLRELNIEIVKLEELGAPAYRQQLENQKKARVQELEATEAAKPEDVLKPDQEDSEQKALTDEISEKMALQGALEEAGRRCVEETTTVKSNLQQIVSLQERVMTLKSDAEELIAEITPLFKALGIESGGVLSVIVNIESVSAKIEQLQKRLLALESPREVDFSKGVNVASLHSLSDIRRAYAHVGGAIEILKERLGAPQRRYQQNVERIADWLRNRDEILGSDDDPKPNTVRGIEAQLRYLDEDLAVNLEERRRARIGTLSEIFAAKQRILKFYADLKRSVDDRLASVRADGFWIEIRASFVIDRDFRRRFLEHVNRRKRGVFRDAQEADAELTARVGKVDWNDLEAVKDFLESLLEKMKSHNGAPIEIGDQVHNVKELYDYLFSLDYIDARYELRLSGKNLNELSPGEKGLLLLVFYLQLDRQNTPLVIDQPEDNLDNDSIFQVLAECIREAKKTRQVILVTHNPNLAVGADAEQIIYVKLDKAKNYQFSWEAGGIENPKINQRIVDVLEGSQPAFVKRRLKYGIV